MRSLARCSIGDGSGPEVARLVSNGALLGLVGGLYEVAVAPALWPSWLTQLCHALRVEAAVLALRVEPRVGDQGIFIVGFPDLTAADIRRTLRSDIPVEDARLRDKLLALAPGELVVLSEAFSDDELAATRLYRDGLQPRGLHHLVCLIVYRTPMQVTGLVLLRRREGPVFVQAELDLLQRLFPHLQRATRIQEMLLASELRLEVAEKMLESFGCGAILVDDAGHAYGANQRAAALLERGEGLALDRGRLRAENRRETAALRRLVRSVATEHEAARYGGVLAVSRAGQRSALVVSVSPLHSGERRPPPVAGALLLLSDPEDFPAPRVPALRRLYGLTEAEAGVASRIAQGESIEAIAAALGVQRATIRTHLDQVFAKTGTYRQAELVRLLLLGTRTLTAPGYPVRVPAGRKRPTTSKGA